MTASELPSLSFSPPTLSVVICTRNRPDKIGAAVSSVLANDHESFELVVVDQSTDDATASVLRPIDKVDRRLTYTHVCESGLSRAYNTGIRHTTGELIAFTDDDCIVPRDWLRRIERAFTDDPEADLLYGQVVALPDALADGSMVPDLSSTTALRLGPGDRFRVFGMGANFAARRDLFERVGGFDELLGGGAPLRSSQDFDLAYRSFLSGSVIVFRPEVTLLHDGGRNPQEWVTVQRNYGIGDGAFYSKHVRCGDLYALSLLLRRICMVGAGLTYHSLLGRRVRPEYLLGMFTGMRDGLRFPVDKKGRVYVAL